MGQTIPALKLSLAPHRVIAALTAGRVRDEQRYGGALSPLRLVDLPRPARPRGWVRISPLLAGICGSDRKLLAVTGMELSLTALYGLPRRGIVPGHEIVGTVTEADPDAGLAPGDRVVAEPTLSCAHKGFPTCERCARGDDHLCAHFADAGDLGPGSGFGFDARYGGGWATELVAPADRVHRVPEGLDDRSAVLAEPTAIAVHAVLRELPPPGSHVLVIGPGTIGLSVVLALRALAPDVRITVAGVSEVADELARRAGADDLVHGTRRDLVEGVGRVANAVVRGSRLSGPVLEDGVDAVFDCVGSEQTIDDGLRCLRPRGTLVLVGTAGRQTVDWSFVWHRELTVRGTVNYGLERPMAGSDDRRRTFAIALDLLSEARPGHLVTHVFRLDESIEALRTAAAGPGAGAVKVAFAPTG